MKINLSSLGNYSIPFEQYTHKWIFTDKFGIPATADEKIEITPLTAEAATFLWEHEMNKRVQSTPEFFKNESTFESQKADWQAIKNYLFNLEIPPFRKVFVSSKPDVAFILTWKLLIKFSQRIFTESDKAVWDLTLNWKMEFDNKGMFTFGKNFIES